jgi:hypothetical protein
MNRVHGILVSLGVCCAAIIVACQSPLGIDTKRVITTDETPYVYNDSLALPMVLVDTSFVSSDVPRWFCEGAGATYARLDTSATPARQSFRAHWRVYLPPGKPEPAIRRISVALTGIAVSRIDSVLIPQTPDSVFVVRARHQNSQLMLDTLRAGDDCIVHWSAGIDRARRQVMDTLRLTIAPSDDPPGPVEFRAVCIFRY